VEDVGCNLWWRRGVSTACTVFLVALFREWRRKRRRRRRREGGGVAV